MSNPIEQVTSALRRLNLSDNEQRVYLSLLREGRATARVLSSRTGITRPSVYDQLKTLRKLGLIVELDIEGKTFFASANIRELDALLVDQIDRLQQSRVFLEKALPSFIESLDTVDPKVRFFEGEEGVKQLLKDIMWHDNTTLKIIWPHKQMREVFDEKFLHWFDERRAKRSLTIKSLWPNGTKKTDVSLFTQQKGDESRTLKKGADTKMTSIIYDTKVAFVSSSAEAYGFITESKEFSDLERIKFDALWGK